jgi:FMN phosphatase YigB (HAD superfamily)
VSAAGCLPQQVLHVGDDLDLDVVGAERAGLQAVLYSPDSSDSTGSGSVAIVRSLKEIVRLVDNPLPGIS